MASHTPTSTTRAAARSSSGLRRTGAELASSVVVSVDMRTPRPAGTEQRGGQGERYCRDTVTWAAGGSWAGVTPGTFRARAITNGYRGPVGSTPVGAGNGPGVTLGGNMLRWTAVPAGGIGEPVPRSRLPHAATLIGGALLVLALFVPIRVLAADYVVGGRSPVRPGHRRGRGAGRGRPAHRDLPAARLAGARSGAARPAAGDPGAHRPAPAGGPGQDSLVGDPDRAGRRQFRAAAPDGPVGVRLPARRRRAGRRRTPRTRRGPGDRRRLSAS